MLSRLPPPPGAAGRAPLRNPVHQPARPGILEARGRDGEILTRGNRFDPVDQFELPREMIEKGWTYQWVRKSCIGKDDPANLTNHHMNAWRPVPASRCPGHFHEHSYTGAIERDGLILMERPTSLEHQARADDLNKARRQKHNQAAEFNGVDRMLEETPGAHAGFAVSSAETDSRGVARPILNRSIEAAPTDAYPKREYAIGDDD